MVTTKDRAVRRPMLGTVIIRRSVGFCRGQEQSIELLNLLGQAGPGEEYRRENIL